VAERVGDALDLGAAGVQRRLDPVDDIRLAVELAVPRLWRVADFDEVVGHRDLRWSLPLAAASQRRPEGGIVNPGWPDVAASRTRLGASKGARSRPAGHEPLFRQRMT